MSELRDRDWILVGIVIMIFNALLCWWMGYANDRYHEEQRASRQNRVSEPATTAEVTSCTINVGSLSLDDFGFTNYGSDVAPTVPVPANDLADIEFSSPPTPSLIRMILLVSVGGHSLHFSVDKDGQRLPGPLYCETCKDYHKDDETSAGD